MREVLDVFDAGEELAEFAEIELGDVNRRGEIEFAFAGRFESGEDADVLVVRLDVATELEAIAVARAEADVFVRNEGVDQALEVVEVGLAVGLVPTGGSGAAGDEDGEGLLLSPWPLVSL